MNKFSKLPIYIFLILSIAHLAKSRPVQVELDRIAPATGGSKPPQNAYFLPVNTQRAERQVVQPKWLSEEDKPLLPVDGKVRITEKNLAEIAQLREEIQKAVEEDSYFAQLTEEDFSKNGTSEPFLQRPQPLSLFGPWNTTPWSMSFQQPRQFGPWDPASWSIPFQQQQPHPFGVWTLQQQQQHQPQQFGQWPVPFQQRQQQHPLFPPGNSAQFPMQFEWPTMGPPRFQDSHQSDVMQRMWTDFMENMRRMLEVV